MTPSIAVTARLAFDSVVWSCPSLLIAFLAIAFCIGSLMLLLAPLWLPGLLRGDD